MLIFSAPRFTPQLSAKYRVPQTKMIQVGAKGVGSLDLSAFFCADLILESYH